MDYEKKEVMAEVFCRVLEKLAFMFGEEVEKEELSGEGESYYHSMISFKGSCSGAFGIAAPVNFCLELAANVLGMDPDEDEVKGKAGDALKELLNMMCGQLLTDMFGDEEVFDLSVPRLSEMDKTGWEKLVDDPKTVGFFVDDFPVLGYLVVKS